MNEEQRSPSVPVMTMEEQLYHLQSVSFQLRNEFTATELSHPLTRQRLQQLSQLIDQLLIMKSQDKEMGEWEWTQWIQFSRTEHQRSEVSGQKVTKEERQKKTRDRKDSLETSLRQMQGTAIPNDMILTEEEDISSLSLSSTKLLERNNCIDEINPLFKQLILEENRSNTYEVNAISY